MYKVSIFLCCWLECFISERMPHVTAKHKMHSLKISANTKAQNEASGEFSLIELLRNSSMDKSKGAISAWEQHCESCEVL